MLISKYSNVGTDFTKGTTTVTTGFAHIQTFAWTLSSQEIKVAMSRGKIASLLGVEGYVHKYAPKSLL